MGIKDEGKQTAKAVAQLVGFLPCTCDALSCPEKQLLT